MKLFFIFYFLFFIFLFLVMMVVFGMCAGFGVFGGVSLVGDFCGVCCEGIIFVDGCCVSCVL